MDDEKEEGQQESRCIVAEAEKLADRLHQEAQDMVLRGDLELRHPRVCTITRYGDSGYDNETGITDKWSYPYKVIITSNEEGTVVEIYEHKRLHEMPKS